MSCITPLTLVRKQQRMDGSLTDVVPCGKCPKCIKRRQQHWAFRLLKEQEQSISSCFLTLTYDEENVPFSKNGLMTLKKTDHQNFMKRIRQQIKRDQTLIPNQPPLKYYACGEYGSKTMRPHFHSIIFNLPEQYIYKQEIIQEVWSHGNIMAAVCNIKSINYVTGYIDKKHDWKNAHPLDDREREISMMSKGMGSTFLKPNTKQFYREKELPYLIIEDGKKMAFPRYYKDKIYTKDQQKRIGLQSKKYALENHPYESARHELDYVTKELEKHKRELTQKRLII